MKKFTEVMEYELDDFISNYPKELIKTANFKFDPPVISYNDFSLEDPKVAEVHLYSSYNKTINDDCYILTDLYTPE